jgi:TPP-dependent 2-oxoacid decarboxylase
MILKIIDENLKEYEFDDFNTNYFTFSLNKAYIANPGNQLLTISNTREINIEEKANLYNLSKILENIKIKTVILENPNPINVNIRNNDLQEKEKLESSFKKLFDNNIYNLEYVGIEYASEYFTHAETAESYDKIRFIFHFI